MRLYTGSKGSKHVSLSKTATPILVAAGLSLAAGCLPPSGPPPLVSSPSSAAKTGVPAFVDHGVTPTPLAAKVQPFHPYLSSGRNGAHQDTNNSDVTNEAGPVTTNLSVTTHKMNFLGQACPAMMTDAQGRIMTICIGFGKTYLYLIDPYSLEILAKRAVPAKTNINIGGENDSSGGGYLHVDPEGRMIINQTDDKVVTYEIRNNGGRLSWGIYESLDLSSALPADANINDAMPDWQGNMWINTNIGVVGYYDSANDVFKGHTFSEGMQNAIAIDDTGVYAVTHGNLNKLVIDGVGDVAVAWSTAYDNSQGQVPGLLAPGSGTSPTLFGENSDLVAIADNATPQLHLNIYHRTSGNELCSVDIFTPGAGTENSPMGYGNSIAIENNGNYDGLFGDPRTTNAGLVKIDVSNITTTSADCVVAWENTDLIASTTPQLSTATGMIYSYSLKAGYRNYYGYYVSTVDWTTGATVTETYVGSGRDFMDNLQMMVLSQGAYIMATGNGLFVARDAQ